MWITCGANAALRSARVYRWRREVSSFRLHLFGLGRGTADGPVAGLGPGRHRGIGGGRRFRLGDGRDGDVGRRARRFPTGARAWSLRLDGKPGGRHLPAEGVDHPVELVHRREVAFVADRVHLLPAERTGNPHALALDGDQHHLSVVRRAVSHEPAHVVPCDAPGPEHPRQLDAAGVEADAQAHQP